MGHKKKAKNSEKRRLRWAKAIGIALFIAVFTSPLMVISFFAGLLSYEDGSPTSVDELAREFSASFPDAYTILQQDLRAEPSGTLYLAGWIQPTETSCLAAIWVKQYRGIRGPHAFQGSKADCGLGRYSNDQFWTGTGWSHNPFSVAYGFSGDAKTIVVTWQDKTVTNVTAVNGSYLAIHEEKSQVIKSVDFYNDSGSLVYRFPDSMRTGASEPRSGS